MIDGKYLNIISNASVLYKIPGSLIVAIIKVESSGDPNAIRYEKNFKYITDISAYAKRLGLSSDTEEILQKCSFGLMQIMGGTARDLGYRDNLVKLFDPQLNINYGAKKLSQLFYRYHENIDDMISAYNQGNDRKTADGLYANQGYVNKVKAILNSL